MMFAVDAIALMRRRERDLRIAHLAIHGWEPVREVPSAISGYGIFNRALGVGFRVTGFGTDLQKVRNVDPHRFVPCEWDDVRTEVLDIIDARLAQT